MKVFKITTFASLMFASIAAQAAQPIINLNVGGEIAPGIYGEVQFGNAPPPPVYYPQPKVVVRPPRDVELAPVYMHVPPRHAKNWRRYCRDYDACGRNVYFVRSKEYEPGYRKGRDRDHDHHKRGGGDHGEHRGRD